MGNFSFDNTIPSSSHDPSVDQGPLLTNNQSNALIWDEDHLGFGVNNGGTHTFLRFFNSIAASLGSNTCVVYPGARPASWSNSGGSPNATMLAFNKDSSTYPFPMMAIKAGGTFSTSGLTFSTQFNCANVANPSTRTYTVTLQTGITTGNNVIVMLTAQNTSLSAGSVLSYTFASNVLTIKSTNPAPDVISFIVMQV